MKHGIVELGAVLMAALCCSAVSAAPPGPSLRMPSVAKILNTDALARHGYDGTGVRVGVISDGVSNYAVLARAGLLPRNVALFGDTPGDGDEGDWMMQVVHAIAPAAKLAFCPAKFHSARQVADCAKLLVEQFHADIIADDINDMPVMWFPTHKAVADGALKRGHPDVLFFTGAGNNGGGYYQSAWMPATLTVSGSTYQAQDFGRSVGQGSRLYDSTSLPPNSGMHIFLGSNVQPGGARERCPSTNPEVTLAVLDAQNNLLAAKTSRCPLLELSYSNASGAMQRLRIAILLRRDLAVSNLAFKMAVIQSGQVATGPVELRYGSGGGAGNSATMPGLMAVAVVDPNTGQGGRFMIESYANSGPQCLDYSGSAQAGTLVRLPSAHCFRQPAFVVPDRTIVAYPSQNSAGYTMKPFLGDSSASPAAAGVAALLLSAHVPPGRIEALLKRTARAQTNTSAWDAHYGHGLIDADAAAVAAGVLPQRAAGGPPSADSTSGIFRPSPAFRRQRKLMMAARQGNHSALASLEAGARQGDADAQTWLAVYDHGTGNNQDAARWCWAAAQQGQPAAEYYLGILFYKGWGVAQDQRASHAWWLRAARTGLVAALYHLGLSEVEGQGAATDFVNGYALMLAAQQRGRVPAASKQILARIRSHLNQVDITKALVLAKRYAADPAVAN